MRPDLDALVAEWAPRLGLHSWRIKAKYCKARDLGEENQAEVEYRFTKEAALIKVLDPDEWDNDTWEQDVEESVVHELVHLALMPVVGPEEATTAEEQYVNRMSQALVGIKRG